MGKNDRIVPGKTGDKGVGCREGMGVEWLKKPVREPYESIILEKMAGQENSWRDWSSKRKLFSFLSGEWLKWYMHHDIITVL